MSNDEIKWDFSAPMIMTSSHVQFIKDKPEEVMRITRNGVWISPDLKTNEAVKVFLEALDFEIKVLMRNAVEAEREACARVAETHQYVAGWGVAAAIRARGEENKS